MTIKEISWSCTRKPKRDGSLDLERPRYDIFVANEGGTGGYDNLEGLDIEDLQMLHSLLQEIFAYDYRNNQYVSGMLTETVKHYRRVKKLLKPAADEGQKGGAR